MAIPLVDLKAQYVSIKDEIDKAIQDVLESQVFILGPKVKELEEKIAKYSDVKYGIAVASGSDALLLALMAIGVGYGDEVITTPFTFFATAGSISRLGAKPVFVDIDLKTYNINPNLIEAKITNKTKAIIPVHLYGQCADMDPILDIAKSHNLYVIEDAAQAIGSKYKDKMAGSMGHLGCLSFFPTKNLGGYGDGGMVLTNDSELAEKLNILRAHGSKPKYYHSVIGVN
ncbi:TPA: DegT/DnrJ/EryC1/StrS family aminotransferase, partial [bacterium]|nr:DegT/DnrJ/EryC1/StrS family aminotransferase [bacterium]